MDKIKILKGLGIGATIGGAILGLIAEFLSDVYQTAEINQKIDEGLEWRFDELTKMIRGEDD